jgi:hypothetical protein
MNAQWKASSVRGFHLRNCRLNFDHIWYRESAEFKIKLWRNPHCTSSASTGWGQGAVLGRGVMGKRWSGGGGGLWRWNIPLVITVCEKLSKLEFVLLITISKYRILNWYSYHNLGIPISNLFPLSQPRAAYQILILFLTIISRCLLNVIPFPDNYLDT